MTQTLLGLPTMLGMIDPDKEDTVGDLRSRIMSSVGESGNLAFHLVTSWLERA